MGCRRESSKSTRLPERFDALCTIHFVRSTFNMPLTWTLMFTIAMSLVSVITVIGNALIVTVYIREARLRRSHQNLFITSLAFADFVVGLIGVPGLLWAKQLGDHVDNSICDPLALTYGSFLSVTMYHLASISADRYVKVLHPNVYKQHFTFKRYLIVLLAIWTVPNGVLFYLVFVTEHSYLNSCDWLILTSHEPSYPVMFFIIVVIYLSSFVLTFSNWKLYRLATRIKIVITSEISHQQSANVRGRITYDSGIIKFDKSAEWKCTRRLKEHLLISNKHRSAAFLIAIIVIAFNITWIPCSTVYLLREQIEHHWSSLFFPWLGLSNLAVNPIILISLSEEYRISIRKLFRSRGSKRFVRTNLTMRGQITKKDEMQRCLSASVENRE